MTAGIRSQLPIETDEEDVGNLSEQVPAPACASDGCFGGSTTVTAMH